jgi:hypothetical protein
LRGCSSGTPRKSPMSSSAALLKEKGSRFMAADNLADSY